MARKILHAVLRREFPRASLPLFGFLPPVFAAVRTGAANQPPRLLTSKGWQYFECAAGK